MNTPSSLLGVLFDHTIGNILRMLAVIRLPKLERGRVSRGFVATLIVIMGYGLVMLFSASYARAYYYKDSSFYYIRKQIIWSVIGIAGMIGASFINYHYLRKFVWPLYVGSILLCMAC